MKRAAAEDEAAGKGRRERERQQGDVAARNKM